MMKRKLKTLLIGVIISVSNSYAGEIKGNLLTTEEKIDLLCANAPVISRLGIMRYDWWSEALHGVARAGKATAFPKPIGMGATWDTDLVHRIGNAISDEARAKYYKSLRENGFSKRQYGLTFFSPTLNIGRDPRWGRTNECFSEDPLLTADMGVAFIKGMQGDDPYYLKTVATAKHFVANNEENRRLGGSATVDRLSLNEYYFPAFRAAVEKGKVASIMGAYNALNGVPCCASPWLLTDVLRKQWGFKGVVISDGSAVQKIRTHQHYKNTDAEATAAALKAGCDMTLRDEYRQGLRDALHQGLITVADIDSAVNRVIDLRKRLGINTPNDYSPYSNMSYDVVESDAHRALALEAAEKSLVLLKNDEDLLPLKLDNHLRIALIGDAFRTTYYGDYAPSPEFNLTLLDCLTRELKDKARITWVGTNNSETVLSKYLLSQPTEKAYDGLAALAGKKGNEKNTVYSDPDSLVSVASASDIAILYIRDDNSSEGRDRKTLNLSEAQLRLIQTVCKANPNTILLLGSGTTNILTPVARLPKAILSVWIAGEGEAQAIANVLLGKISPSGKTPITYYANERQLPALDDYNVRHGRSYQYFQGEVLYPFGYGLSYTRFDYSRPTIFRNATGDITAMVDVKNAGKMTGDEIVQCYASCPEWQKTGLKRRLVAYSRISLKPGENKTIGLAIPRELLCRYDTLTDQWHEVASRYTIDVVSNSAATNSVTLRTDDDIMMYSDTTRIGRPYAKDPYVVFYKGRYLMYYSIPSKRGGTGGWGIGIAESKDKKHWIRVGEVERDPNAYYERKGYCAPCAQVVDGKLHLFYQTYGNGRGDAICHAVSDDGLHFTRDASNPIFSPTGDWNCGRAIDAEVKFFKGKWFLYFASRDKAFKRQIQGVAVAPKGTDFSRGQWKLAVDAPTLTPDLPWEENCIEGASVVEHKGKLYLFYGGAYNNYPQQIGVAVSSDGIHFKRVYDKPLLTNGASGEWNSSESGHPDIFRDADGSTTLFYQGNSDNGRTWYISSTPILWDKKGPHLP